MLKYANYICLTNVTFAALLVRTAFSQCKVYVVFNCYFCQCHFDRERARTRFEMREDEHYVTMVLQKAYSGLLSESPALCVVDEML